MPQLAAKQTLVALEVLSACACTTITAHEPCLRMGSQSFFNRRLKGGNNGTVFMAHTTCELAFRITSPGHFCEQRSPRSLALSNAEFPSTSASPARALTRCGYYSGLIFRFAFASHSIFQVVIDDEIQLFFGKAKVLCEFTIDLIGNYLAELWVKLLV